MRLTLDKLGKLVDGHQFDLGLSGVDANQNSVFVFHVGLGVYRKKPKSQLFYFLNLNMLPSLSHQFFA